MVFTQEESFMTRDNYIHKRQNGIYYVEFIDKVSGKKLSARSTGESELLKAQVKAELWLVNGIPTGRMKKPRPIEEAAGIESIIRLIGKTELNADDAIRIVEKLKNIGLIDIPAVKNTGRGAVPFVQFLAEFWDYEKSEYIRDQLTHGYRLSKRYAYECQKRVKSILTPFFRDKKLNCVTGDDLNKLTDQLSEKGLATSTRHQILMVCQTPLRWCYKKNIIPADPTKDLTKFSIKNEKRGVLTIEEARALFYTCKDLWEDKRAYVANLVSAATGARQGECLALRRSDIGEEGIVIDNSYSPLEGLKCTKNGESRPVPLLPIVRVALMDLLKDNPHNVDDPFIFYSVLPDKPCDCKLLLDGLKKTIESVNAKYLEAAKKAKLDKPEIHIDYKSRNITFHSWRHFFCSKSTQKISGEKVAKVSGHLSRAVFEKYEDHIEEDNVREVGNAIAEVFENIIPFPAKKAG
jgi:integrase